MGVDMPALPAHYVTTVDDHEVSKWLSLAHSIRTLEFVVSNLGLHSRSSQMGVDDSKYPAEKCSDWAMSYIRSALEHLGQWADLVVPRRIRTEADGGMHFRPQLMLGRAGLESASQAVWMLSPNDSNVRIYRHVRLMLIDLMEEKKAMQAEGNVTAAKLIGDMEGSLRQSATGVFPGATLKPIGYRDLVHQAAESLGQNSEVWERAWMGASAAAHGRRWLSDHAYDIEMSDGGSPVLWAPRSSAVTEIVDAAYEALHGALHRYCILGRIDSLALWRRGVIYSASLIPANPGHEHEKALSLSAMEAHLLVVSQQQPLRS